MEGVVFLGLESFSSRESIIVWRPCRRQYSEEFKDQVAREFIEKERIISSVASSCDLTPRTVGNWVARYRK